MPKGRPPNPLYPEIRAMYRAGHRKVDIARALSVSKNVVHIATIGEPPRAAGFRYPNGYLRGGYRYGQPSVDIPESLEPLVVANIKGDESIIACLCRLLIQHKID